MARRRRERDCGIAWAVASCWSLDAIFPHDNDQTIRGSHRSLARASAAAQIPQREFAARRDSLAKRIDSGVVVAFGGRTPVTDFGPFYQIPAFHYLTNFDEPDAAFVMVVRHGVGDADAVPHAGRPAHGVLLRLASGLRGRSTRRSASTARSVHRARARSSIRSRRPGCRSTRSTTSRTPTSRAADSLTRGQVVRASRSRRSIRGLVVKDAHAIVDQLRAKKSAGRDRAAAEGGGDQLRGTSRRDARARAAARVRAPGRRSSTPSRDSAATRPAYGSIVGSGQNGTQLHYMKDRGATKPGDVVVIDAAAEYEGYAADITRTIPVSGTFTPEQSKIYQLVRDAQAAAERNSKPGMSAPAAQDSSVAVRAKGLAALGLVESEDATFDPPWQANCDAHAGGVQAGDVLDDPRHQPRARPRRARSGAVLVRRSTSTSRATCSRSSRGSTSARACSTRCPTRRRIARSSRR